MNYKWIINGIICLTFVYQNPSVAQSYTSSESRIMIEPLIQPEYLKAGDTIAIVAPSGVLNNQTQEITKAKTLLENWGLKVLIGKNVFKKSNHFAGTDSERIQDFQNALDNPNIKAIWCARGGYGTVRIIDKLNYSLFKKHPKWVIGYSDITAIHNQLNIEGIQSIHAMMCTSLSGDLSSIEKTISTFKSALFGIPLQYDVKGSKYNKTGQATAPLVGGNLTLLHTMLGSKTSINTSNKILFIEEIGEYKYHIDRMLQSLKRAGYFKNLKGLVVGDISKIRKNTTPWGSSIEELILDVVAEYEFPVLFNFPAGHEDNNYALILGKTIELSISKESSLVNFK